MKELAPAEGLTKPHSYLHRWALKADGLPFHTHACWLQPVRYHGELAMLKIATEDEERRGAFLMRWWDGVGAVRALAHEGDALLLERASGDRLLIDMARTGQDDEASRIMCQVAASLHTPRTGAKPELIPLSRRFESLRQVAKTHAGVFEQAAFIAEGLLAAQSEIVVLHGDIHHGNVLDAGARGWLAIDPKGLEGERAFDFAIFSAIPTRALPRHPAASRGKSR